MTYTADDLIPGAVFDARNQGTCITPQTVKVTVRHVGADTVWYTGAFASTWYDTPIERFLSIINDR